MTLLGRERERGEYRDRAGREEGVGGWLGGCRVGAVYFGTGSVSAGKRDARRVAGQRVPGAQCHNWWPLVDKLRFIGLWGIKQVNKRTKLLSRVQLN